MTTLHEKIPEGQWRALLAVNLLSYTLSAAGSTAILSIACRRKHRNETYGRLLIYLAVSDLGLTILGVLTAGLGSRPDYEAYCNILGPLFGYFLTNTVLHNTSVAVYFLLVVRWGWKDRKLRNRFEIPATCFSIIWPLLLQAYTSLDASFAPGATSSICIASFEPSPLPTVLSMLTAIGAVTVSWVSTIVVASTVRERYRRTMQYAFDSSFSAVAARKAKETRTQAIYYCIAFTNTVFFTLFLTIIVRVTSLKLGDPIMFLLQVVAFFFFPLQGFFNFFVYIRPRVARWKEIDNEITWWKALVLVVRDIPESRVQRQTSAPNRQPVNLQRYQRNSSTKSTPTQPSSTLHQDQSSLYTSQAWNVDEKSILDLHRNDLDETESTLEVVTSPAAPANTTPMQPAMEDVEETI